MRFELLAIAPALAQIGISFLYGHDLRRSRMEASIPPVFCVTHEMRGEFVPYPAGSLIRMRNRPSPTLSGVGPV